MTFATTNTTRVMPRNWWTECAGSAVSHTKRPVSAGYSTVEPYNANPNATTWYGKPVEHPGAVGTSDGAA